MKYAIPTITILLTAIFIFASSFGCDDDCAEKGDVCYLNEDDGPTCCDDLYCHIFSQGATSGECREEE